MRIFILLLFFQSSFFSIPPLHEFIRSKGQQVIEGHLNPGQVEWVFLNQFIKQHPEISLIGEIGFNAGHSSQLFLDARPQTKVISFDIGYWPYVKTGKNYIDRFYPRRHELILGDSLVTVPLFHQKNPNTQFDLIFVDGGHSYECAKGDIENMRNLAKPSTFIVVDDMQAPAVAKAWEDSKNEGLVEEILRKFDPQAQIGFVLGRYLFR